jgi:hypothetical protein
LKGQRALVAARGGDNRFLNSHFDCAADESLPAHSTPFQSCRVTRVRARLLLAMRREVRYEENR